MLQGRLGLVQFSNPTKCRLRAQPVLAAATAPPAAPRQFTKPVKKSQVQQELESLGQKPRKELVQGLWEEPARARPTGLEKRAGLSKRAFNRARTQAKSPEEYLLKVIAKAGVASRRKAEELVRQGQVKVDDVVIVKPEHLVRADVAKISVNGRPLPKAAEPVYFAVNKPKGYLCANVRTRGEEQRKLVVDLIQDHFKSESRSAAAGGKSVPRLFTVGRLDVASTGLIFVTNDGSWGQKVQHPSGGLTKEYLVTTTDMASRRQLDTIAEGCSVDGEHVVPVAVGPEQIAPGSSRHRLRVIVSEGRNREVRNLVANAGLEVTALKRVRIGGYKLPRSLAIGQVKELKMSEVRRILDLGVQRDYSQVEIQS